MKINGHLQDFSLQDLLRILTNLRESGCLKIDFQPEPGVFYFSRGQLVEGRLLEAKGDAAIKLALSLPNASFQFDDDVEIPESVRAVVPQPPTEPRLEGLRLSIETAPPITHRVPESITSAATASSEAPALLTESDDVLEESLPVSADQPVPGRDIQVPGRDIQLIYPQQSFSYIHRQRLITAAVAILLLAVSAAVAITIHLRAKAMPASAESLEEPVVPENRGASVSNQTGEDKSGATSTAEPSVADEPSSSRPQIKEAENRNSADTDTPKTISQARNDARDDAQRNEASDAHVKRLPSESKTILVMVQITDGRVTEAWVKDPRKGSEAVEAAAIRMARQRHYPANITRTEAVAISVTINH